MFQVNDVFINKTLFSFQIQANGGIPAEVYTHPKDQQLIKFNTWTFILIKPGKLGELSAIRKIWLKMLYKLPLFK